LISNIQKFLKDTQKSPNPYIHAKTQTRKRSAVLQKRLGDSRINRKIARNSKQLFFLRSEDKREPYIMLQQQVAVTAVTQGLTGGSTLTIKKIQHNSSMTLGKQYMQATVLKSNYLTGFW